MEVPIDLELTASAKEEMRRFMEQVPADHVLSISQWGTPGAPGAEWGIGAYTREQVEAVEREILSRGHGLKYVVDGIEIVIEPHFAALLNGKRLDFNGRQFIAFDREEGI